jgi:hypothetical protein
MAPFFLLIVGFVVVGFALFGSTHGIFDTNVLPNIIGGVSFFSLLAPLQLYSMLQSNVQIYNKRVLLLRELYSSFTMHVATYENKSIGLPLQLEKAAYYATMASWSAELAKINGIKDKIVEFSALSLCYFVWAIISDTQNLQELGLFCYLIAILWHGFHILQFKKAYGYIGDLLLSDQEVVTLFQLKTQVLVALNSKEAMSFIYIVPTSTNIRLEITPGVVRHLSEDRYYCTTTIEKLGLFFENMACKLHCHNCLYPIKHSNPYTHLYANNNFILKGTPLLCDVIFKTCILLEELILDEEVSNTSVVLNRIFNSLEEDSHYFTPYELEMNIQHLNVDNPSIASGPITLYDITQKYRLNLVHHVLLLKRLDQLSLSLFKEALKKELDSNVKNNRIYDEALRLGFPINNPTNLNIHDLSSLLKTIVIIIIVSASKANIKKNAD